MSDLSIPTDASAIDFAEAIRATAIEMKRQASHAQVSIIDALAKACGQIDSGSRTVAFQREDGTVETVSEFLVREVGKLPQAFTADPNASANWTGLTAEARFNVDRIRRQDEADAIAHAQALAAGPNPWSKTSFNQTKQAMIRRHLPQIAMQLKAKAVK